MRLNIRSLLRAMFVLAAVLYLDVAAAQAPHTHEHSFGNAKKWSKVFDDPTRDAWQKPLEVIQALKLEPDAVVADIGAGTGYFAVRFAHMVPKGRVYALDTEADMVKHLSERARREGWWDALPATRNGKVAVVDGNQFFNRPGPRLVDAFEWLVGVINGRPELMPPGFACAWLA